MTRAGAPGARSLPGRIRALAARDVHHQHQVHEPTERDEERAELVGRAEALYEQIFRLDEALYRATSARPQPNPVSDQMAQLQKAAETGLFDPLKVWRRNT